MSVPFVRSALAVLAFASPVAAQQIATPAVTAPAVLAPAVAVAPTTSVSPRITEHVVGVQRSSALAQPAPTLVPQSRQSGVPLMVVGGAALLVGAVVGGDAGTIVMIGGGIIGLVGLWRYIQ
jgi:hypothetical protein